MRSWIAVLVVTACSGDVSPGGDSSSDASTQSSGAATSGEATTSNASSSGGTTSSTGGSASGETTGEASSEDTSGPPPGEPGSLRFFGQGGTYDDRVLVRVDDPADTEPGPAIDVGAEDFTIELWIRPDAAGNPNPAIACGNTNAWVESNIVVDRDRHSQAPSYGIGIAGGVMVWAVQGEGGDP